MTHQVVTRTIAKSEFFLGLASEIADSIVAETAKRELSTSMQTEVSLPFIASDGTAIAGVMPLICSSSLTESRLPVSSAARRSRASTRVSKPSTWSSVTGVN